MFPLYVTTQNLDQYDISFNRFKNKAISEQSISLSLKNNDEIDTSPWVEMISRLKTSDYADDLFKMEVMIYQASDYGFATLCQNSSSKNSCMEKAKNSVESAFDRVIQENRIRYPKNYIGIYERHPISDRLLNTANEILDSECPGVIDMFKLSSIISHIHPHQWPELQNKLKHKDKAFLNQILQEVYTDLTEDKYPAQCFDLANKNHKICRQIQEDFRIKKQRVTYLMELVYGEDILKTTEAIASCLDCEEDSLFKDLSEFNQLFSTLKEHSMCFDPALGKEKQVTNNIKTYTVRREQDGSFSIPLNLNFVADEDYDGDVPRAEVPAYYKNKVQECMEKANSKMLGPNGEKLKVVIESPSVESACEQENSQTIRIGSRNHRDNAIKYSSDSDCVIITHEVLHLLGLCDEYREVSRGFYVSADTGEIHDTRINEDDRFVPAYDCRVISKNSIMSNHYGRWYNVFESGGTEESLLNPGQFSSILYGDCPSKNALFNECADLAYRSSVHHENCLEQKRKCMENNVMEHDKTEELSRIRERIHATREAGQSFKEYTEKNLLDRETRLWYEEAIQSNNERLNQLREELNMIQGWPD